MTKTQKRLLISTLSLSAIIGGTYIAIQIAKGYRPTKDGTIKGTGLLAANSFPSGAQVFLNDKLTTATDDTLSLPPGEYQVSIRKEGYIAWEKSLKVEQELVTLTGATLFRSVPGLTPLTLTGAKNLVPSPDGRKIAFAVTDSANQAKNGLYILELTNITTFTAAKEPKLIARSTAALDFSTATLLWSPSSSQILAHFDSSPQDVSNYLLSIDSLNDVPALPDVSARLPVILAQWEEEIAARETKQFALLPEALQAVATASATNVYFSPNDKKVLYTSTGYADLPENLLQTPPSTSTQPETRSLELGNLYIYDLVEDKNFKIGSISTDTQLPQRALLVPNYYQQLTSSDNQTPSTPSADLLPTYNRLQSESSFAQTALNFNTHYSPLYIGKYQWYPDSSHLLIVETDRVDVIEYDATNQITIYSGPFADRFAYPWPDGSKLIILTNLNPQSDLPQNLYGVDIR